MGILEKITQMKRQGISDEEIISRLREERISPKEIKDALSQSQIKNAVSNTETEGMEPSVMQVPDTDEPRVPEPISMQEPIQEDGRGVYAPQREDPNEEAYVAPQGEYYQPQQLQYQQQEYQPQGYQQGYNQPYQESISTDTIIEIAEQVFSEKMKNIQKKLDEFNEFKTLSQTKIENALERLKRIEAIIDKLQISILEKIGTYGNALDDIKKEMNMMQDSFGKIVNPLVNQSEENFSRKTAKSKKSVEDLFPEKVEKQAEENIQEEEPQTYVQEQSKGRKISKR